MMFGAKSQASVVTGVKFTIAELNAAQPKVVDGHVICGAVVSSAVIVWLQVAVRFASSFASQVRVTAYPPVTLLVTVLTTVIVTFGPEHTSLALGAVKVQGVPHSTVASGAQTIFGAVVSWSTSVASAEVATP